MVWPPFPLANHQDASEGRFRLRILSLEACDLPELREVGKQVGVRGAERIFHNGQGRSGERASGRIGPLHKIEAGGHGQRAGSVDVGRFPRRLDERERSPH